MLRTAFYVLIGLVLGLLVFPVGFGVLAPLAPFGPALFVLLCGMLFGWFNPYRPWLAATPCWLLIVGLLPVTVLGPSGGSLVNVAGMFVTVLAALICALDGGYIVARVRRARVARRAAAPAAATA